MPAFLEEKLKKEYPGEPRAPFAIMNTLGAMHGSKETAAGREMEKKHEADLGRKHLLAGMKG